MKVLPQFILKSNCSTNTYFILISSWRFSFQHIMGALRSIFGILLNMYFPKPYFQLYELISYVMMLYYKSSSSQFLHFEHFWLTWYCHWLMLIDVYCCYHVIMSSSHHVIMSSCHVITSSSQHGLLPCDQVILSSFHLFFLSFFHLSVW